MQHRDRGSNTDTVFERVLRFLQTSYPHAKYIEGRVRDEPRVEALRTFYKQGQYSVFVIEFGPPCGVPNHKKELLRRARCKLLRSNDYGDIVRSLVMCCSEPAPVARRKHSKASITSV